MKKWCANDASKSSFFILKKKVYFRDFSQDQKQMNDIKNQCGLHKQF